MHRGTDFGLERTERRTQFLDAGDREPQRLQFRALLRVLGFSNHFLEVLEGDEQRQLSLTEIAGLDVPIKVVWGTQDRVLPTRQAHKLPGRIAVHIFEEAGHMLPLEIAADAAYLILENSR